MKRIFFAAAACAAGAFFGGCTTVESTQVFNRMGLGTPNEKAVCQTYVEIPDLVGMPIKEAIEFLNENKIVFDIVYGGDDNADTVTAQSIEAGKRTEAYVEDGKISLTVGKR